MTMYRMGDFSFARNEPGRAARRVLGGPLADDAPGGESGPVLSLARAPERACREPILVYVVEVHPSANGPTVAIASPETEVETESASARFHPATILHPTDFSRHSAVGFQVACRLAQENRARVVVLHVGPRPPTGRVCNRPARFSAGTPNDDRARLWRTLLTLQAPCPDVRVERRLEAGDAATTILRVAQETSADLIVMGIRGETVQPRPRLGHVAECVIRKAVCPVVALSAPVLDAGRPPTPPPTDVPSQREFEAYWTDLGGEG